MLTLAFDTSSRTAAVAVLRDDTILYDSVINAGLNHSEVLQCLPAMFSGGLARHFFLAWEKNDGGFLCF